MICSNHSALGDFSCKWIVINGTLVLSVNESIIEVPSSDIMRIEFKGQKEYNGYGITVKPSDNLKALKLNRFPVKLSLLLKMPVAGKSQPVLHSLITTGSQKVQLDKISDSDQIIIGSQWFPLAIDDINDIKTLLQQCAISTFGEIPLRQAINLLLTNSEYLSISELDEADFSDSHEKDYSFIEIEETLMNAGFSAVLYPYQKTGVSWLNSIASEQLGCILADEMGLGKTVQIIALLTLYKIKFGLPSLIIAPATLLENWRREFCKFSGKLKVLVHAGYLRTGFPSVLSSNDIVITSYDTVIRDQGMFGMLDWGFVVIDEAQAIKNPDTIRAIAVKKLNRKVSIAVSGTPVENSLMDLWSIMDFSCPSIMGDRSHFESNYKDTESSAAQVERIVSPLMLRRRVVDVAMDLPGKIIIPQAVNMSDEEILRYEALRANIQNEYGTSATLVALIKLRQFCTHPFILDEHNDLDPATRSDKYIRLIEIMEEIVSNKQKVIIFTSFTAMTDLFVNDIPSRLKIPCRCIDGRTPVTERQCIVDQFSTVSGSAVLILNPKAAGTGLNITAANHVIHYNLEWNPAVEDQATARSYRRGQLLPVTIHRLFYPNTIEDVINDRLERKRQLASTAVVGTEATQADKADILKALMISPKKQEE